MFVLFVSSLPTYSDPHLWCGAQSQPRQPHGTSNEYSGLQTSVLYVAAVVLLQRFVSKLITSNQKVNSWIDYKQKWIMWKKNNQEFPHQTMKNFLWKRRRVKIKWQQKQVVARKLKKFEIMKQTYCEEHVKFCDKQSVLEWFLFNLIRTCWLLPKANTKDGF